MCIVQYARAGVEGRTRRFTVEYVRGMQSRRGAAVERIAVGIMIAVMILLFAFVFAILGRGEYEPGGNSQPVISENVA